MIVRHSPSAPLAALGCLCGKRMIEDLNEGTCLWCGHGLARQTIETAYARLAVQTTSPLDGRVVAIRRAPSHEWDQDSCAQVALKILRDTGRFPKSADWQAPRLRGEHRPTYEKVRLLFGGWPAFRQYCADIPLEQVAA